MSEKLPPPPQDVVDAVNSAIAASGITDTTTRFGGPSECPCDAERTVDPWCCAAGECVREPKEATVHPDPLVAALYDAGETTTVILDGKAYPGGQLTIDAANRIIEQSSEIERLRAALTSAQGLPVQREPTDGR